MRITSQRIARTLSGGESCGKGRAAHDAVAKGKGEEMLFQAEIRRSPLIKELLSCLGGGLLSDGWTAQHELAHS